MYLNIGEWFSWNYMENYYYYFFFQNFIFNINKIKIFNQIEYFVF